MAVHRHVPDWRAVFVRLFFLAPVRYVVDALVRGALQPGQVLLALGTGGVSLFAAQLALMSGARVIATTGSDGKIYYVISSERYDVGAQMYSFDPRTKKITHCGDITDGYDIGERDFDFVLMSDVIEHVCRSSGPGGQNVNKVSTRATLWFDLKGCRALTDLEKARIQTRLASRFSSEGVLQVVASRHRTQAANRAAATERLLELLADALRTRKSRRPTKVPKSAKVRRMRDKQNAGERKRLRSGHAIDD